jgi:hypothetical protein
MIAKIFLFPMRLISVLHYADIAFHLAILIITKILYSESRIKKSRIRINLVIVISFGIVFSKNLPVII